MKMQRTLFALANFQNLSAIAVAIGDPDLAPQPLGVYPHQLANSIHFQLQSHGRKMADQ